MKSRDTIFAVASGQPPAAIAVMRVSGPHALTVATALTGSLPPARNAALRAIRDPVTGGLLDRGLVICFPGSRSVTGEDLVELHLHGGRAVIAAVAACLERMDGMRPAVAGEFTRRALLAGRIDLAAAEGLGDLLLAETEGQRRRAIAAVEGAVSRVVAQWSERLLVLSARVEAALDFSDEDDVGEASLPDILADTADLAGDIRSILDLPPVERIRDGLRVVLAGPPNSGKSTLVNALAQREAAIVSPIAGTTRDRIDVAVMRDGIAYVLTDTAGLVETTDDPIEAIGVDRAHEAVASADIVLWLGDDPPTALPSPIWLWPRADVRRGQVPHDRLAVSAKSNEGVSAVWGALAMAAAQLLPRDDQLALNQRQRALCRDCLDALSAIAGEHDLLVVAEQLRLARLALDHITGRTHIEGVLDALFGQFCIGK